MPRLLSNAIDDVDPVPESETDWGLPAASSVTCSVAERAPAAPGLNDTETVHDPFGATVAGADGHVVVDEKSAAFVPEIAMFETASGAVPVFVTVTGCAVLVVLTGCEPNDSVDGATVAAGAVPVPDSGID